MRLQCLPVTVITLLFGLREVAWSLTGEVWYLKNDKMRLFHIPSLKFCFLIVVILGYRCLQVILTKVI